MPTRWPTKQEISDRSGTGSSATSPERPRARAHRPCRRNSARSSASPDRSGSSTAPRSSPRPASSPRTPSSGSCAARSATRWAVTSASRSTSPSSSTRRRPPAAPRCPIRPAPSPSSPRPNARSRQAARDPLGDTGPFRMAAPEPLPNGGPPQRPAEQWPAYAGAPAAESAAAALAEPAEREVHLRHVRHRRVEPLQPRRGRRRRRGARAGVQPAVRLGRLRAGQDPPAARRRALHAAAVPRDARALRVHRGVHQRLHQLPARRPQGRLPAPLPRRRRAAGRRHPVPGGQGRHPGGVLPHLQHPPQREQADRRVLRPAAEAAGDPGRPDAHPVRVGADHRHPAARAGDAHRDPAQEGRAGPAGRARRRAGVHRRADRAQHPRARGRADPGHGVRVAQPAAGRHRSSPRSSCATSSPTRAPPRSPPPRSWR